MNNSQNNFLEAFKNIPIVDTALEYRVYYDKQTHECTSKGVDGADGDYIVVTKEQYDTIDWAPRFYVKKGVILKKDTDLSRVRLLKPSNTGYRVRKGNLAFLIDDESDTNIEYWNNRNWHE